MYVPSYRMMEGFFFAIILNASGMLILLFPFSNFKIENCHGDVWLTFKSMRIYSIIPYSTLSKSIKLLKLEIGMDVDSNELLWRIWDL